MLAGGLRLVIGRDSLRTTGRLVAVWRRGVVWTVALAVSACSIAALASPAVAYVEGTGLACVDGEQNADAVARNMRLWPANGATVQAGPVVFSGESSYSLTFNIASSPALLPDLDVESGIGSQSGRFFEFASTEATVKPGTAYWTASFTFTPGECESPSTFTTPVQTLVIAPNEAELAAVKRQQEEAAARKKLEEEVAAAKRREEEAAAAGRVVVEGARIDVQRGREAAVELTCSDVEVCAGKLTLTATGTVGRGKARHVGSETIGSAGFSIAAGERATVKVALSGAGRALLSAAHGPLAASLKIARTSPLPNETHTQRVSLER
jgi:hypothetical protein